MKEEERRRKVEGIEIIIIFLHKHVISSQASCNEQAMGDNNYKGYFY